jgi:hypothetical protein
LELQFPRPALNCMGEGNDFKGEWPRTFPLQSGTDLTTLARRHAANSPDASVSNVLREGVVMPARPAEMPKPSELYESLQEK